MAAAISPHKIPIIASLDVHSFFDIEWWVKK